MPSFDTPGPLSASVTLNIGDLRVVASDRDTTTVEVRPTDPTDKADVKAAEQTQVDCSPGKLLVKGPHPWRQHSPFGGKGGSVDVTIELPAGSALQGEAALADLRGEGRLGECRFTLATGAIRIEEAGPLHLTTAAGHLTVDRATGDAEVTGSGEVRIGEVTGSAVVKNLNGGSWIGSVTGDLRCTAANGDITVDRAEASVVAKTANGSIRIGEVARGSVSAQTAVGELEIGVRSGTAAQLDLRSHSGTVHSELDPAAGPQRSDETVSIRGRTSYGDIVIRRGAPPRPAPHL